LGNELGREMSDAIVSGLAEMCIIEDVEAISVSKAQNGVEV
jgi:hypothetical protein